MATGWDPTPWGIQGAQHSADVARLLPYLYSAKNSGIVSPEDLKVTANSPTDGTILVNPGAFVGANKFAGGEQQGYVARKYTVGDPIAIAPTGTGAGRSDLIIAEIIDPQFPGNTQPVNGEYVRSRVISGVSVNTRFLSKVTAEAGTTGIALARVDVPANTSAITGAMITSLRRMARTRSDGDTIMINIPPGVNDQLINSNYVNASSQQIYWPDDAVWQVEVPEWATHVTLDVTLSSVLLAGTGAFNGHLRATIGGQSTIEGRYEGRAVSRASLSLGGEIAVPVSTRGTTQTVRVQGKRTNTTTNGWLEADNYTSPKLTYTFKEKAE